MSETYFWSYQTTKRTLSQAVILSGAKNLGSILHQWAGGK